jgi:predicted dehydrogenase
MNKNKIILIGTSSIAEFHVTALKKSGLIPVAVASSNKNSASQKKFATENNIDKNYSDWKKMIDVEEYDGIVIASRIESTLEILEYSIKQNVPVLVEKPITYNSEKLEKLIKNSHEMVMVGYNRRFYKTVNVLKSQVLKSNSPVIGLMITPDFFNTKKFFPNTLHSLDILRHIFGDIKLEFVKKLIVNNKQKGFVATFSNNRNDIIQIIGNWNSSDNFSLSVYQDKKRYELKPYEKLVTYDGIDADGTVWKHIPKIVDEINLENINEVNVDKYMKPGFYNQSCAFLDLIKNGKNNSAASMNDALKNIKIFEKLIGKFEDLL